MDTAQVASAAVAAIAPFMPLLVELAEKGGEKFFRGIADRGGEIAWKVAQEVWNKIKVRLGDDPVVKGASLVLSADPENSQYQALMEQALEKRLEENPKLAKELVEALGGQESVQQILAERSSRIEDASQQMSGVGIQSIQAREKSRIRGVRQVKK
jgi:hypothetical protein